MPPKKNITSVKVSSSSSSSSHSSDEGFSYIHHYPNIRRVVVGVVLLVVIGVPCPPQIFYSFFLSQSPYLHLFYQLGIFAGSSFMCEQVVGQQYSHDHEYYNKFQKTFNLTDEEMFDYLQQWMCVMPPDNYDEFISSTLSRYADIVQEGDVLDDSSFRRGIMEGYDLDSLLQQKDVIEQDYVDERILNYVYQEVESEPLNL